MRAAISNSGAIVSFFSVRIAQTGTKPLQGYLKPPAQPVVPYENNFYLASFYLFSSDLTISYLCRCGKALDFQTCRYLYRQRMVWYGRGMYKEKRQICYFLILYDTFWYSVILFDTLCYLQKCTVLYIINLEKQIKAKHSFVL